MRQIQWIFGIFISAWLITGCAAPATVQRDRSFNFNNIHTYAWVSAVKTKGDNSDKAKINDLTDRRIRETANDILVAKGWKEVSRNPDVLLVYDVVVEKEEKNVMTPAYSYPFTRWFYNPRGGRWVPVYYPSQFIGYDTNTETIREGTLTLTITDADTDKTIWQGWTSSEVNGKRLTDKEISRNVKAILRKLSS